MNIKGLTEEQATTSRNVYGDNKIKEQEPKKFWKEWLATFEDPMMKLLVGVAIVMAVIGFLGFAQWHDAVAVLGIVAIVTLVSTKTNMDSDSAYRKLKKEYSYEECKVYRDGQVKIINVDDIVVGDYVIVQSGEKIHADGWLYHGSIKVNNSALNGESEEVKKQGTVSYQYRKGDMTDNHMLLRGALVVDGDGVMQVTKVGMKTLMGEMAEEMNEKEVDSPLKVKLTQLAEHISMFGYIGSVVIGLAILANSVFSTGVGEWFSQPIPVMATDVLNAVLVAITIVVMAVPEGLPLMIAIVLMQNTSKMLKRNVLVRKAVGIETAGSLNILFSDKTGTITKGQLEVVKFIDKKGNQYDSFEELGEEMRQLVATSLRINTTAMIVDGVATGGNMTDRALLNYVKDVEPEEGMVVDKLETFNSAKKFMATQVTTQHGRTLTLYKGAVERILEKCFLLKEEEVVKLNAMVDEMANQAIRVLAIGYASGELVEGELSPEMQLLGIVGIRDDVRPEARKAIHDIQQAGVQVVMITGDRKETATAIAKESGLISKETDVVLTSDELQEMTDEEVKAVIPNLRVVSRALPTDKSRLVRLSQELGLVAGMGGDGINDSVALKRADVGFAMGSGTESAKEASDIVILDDNFKSITDAVLYGRTIYNNILKFIKFQLTINVVAVVVCALCPFFGVQEPLSVVQLLLINLLMDSLGAMALGGEPALQEYMQEKPKSRTQSIVSKKMMIQVGIMGSFMIALSFIFLFTPWIVEMFGQQHLTGYFVLFMLMAVFNGFNVRSEGINVFNGLKENPMFTKIMLSVTAILVLLTYIGGDLLSVSPMNLGQWLVTVALSMLVIPMGFIIKVLQLKL